MGVGKEIADSIRWHMMKQDIAIERGERKITECEIVRNGYRKDIFVKLNLDGFCEDVILLYSYYPDELSFDEIDFIGKTEAEARKYIHGKDVAYLRS